MVVNGNFQKNHRRKTKFIAANINHTKEAKMHNLCLNSKPIEHANVVTALGHTAKGIPAIAKQLLHKPHSPD